MILRDEMTELIIRSEVCSGCRACEMACSFHHTSTFGRENSSIQVNRNEREGKFEIVLHESDGGERPACDGCVEEEEPACVKFCPINAIMVGNEDE